MSWRYGKEDEAESVLDAAVLRVLHEADDLHVELSAPCRPIRLPTASRPRLNFLANSFVHDRHLGRAEGVSASEFPPGEELAAEIRRKPGPDKVVHRECVRIRTGWEALDREIVTPVVARSETNASEPRP